MATKAADLYDEDFYAWTQQQAEALRTHFQGDNRLDVEHLAEEVEDLGKSELHAVESFVENVIEHLLKLDYSGWVEGAESLASGDRCFQEKHRVARSRPVIRQQVEAELDELYRARVDSAAARSLHQREPDFVRRLPEALSLRLGRDLASRRPGRGGVISGSEDRRSPGATPRTSVAEEHDDVRKRGA